MPSTVGAPTSARLLITTGPESCGKTTLARLLSAELGAPLVEEAARDYLHQHCMQDGHYRYQQSDLAAIAHAQHALELQALRQPAPYVVCDTDLLVILVWSEVRFGTIDPQLSDLFAAALATSHRTYLLCDHQVPWQPDPLREDPDNRVFLFSRYLYWLDHYGLDYHIISGDVTTRLTQVGALLAPAGGCPCCRD